MKSCDGGDKAEEGSVREDLWMCDTGKVGPRREFERHQNLTSLHLLYSLETQN